MSKPCKKCGLPVDWIKIKGRLYCHDAGTKNDHWTACSKERWQVVKKGARFINKTGTGYINDGKISYEMTSSGVIKGSMFKQSDDCIDCCPPWEVCPRPCPMAIA